MKWEWKGYREAGKGHGRGEEQGRKEVAKE